LGEKARRPRTEKEKTGPQTCRNDQRGQEGMRSYPVGEKPRVSKPPGRGRVRGKNGKTIPHTGRTEKPFDGSQPFHYPGTVTKASPGVDEKKKS